MSTLDPLQKISYLSMVWARMKKSRITVFGVWCIAFLVLLAVCAPLVSLNQPFYWNQGGEAHYPFVRALFNRLLFENTVDIFFNLALVLGRFISGYFTT